MNTIKPGSIPALDGLRGVSCLLVLACHSNGILLFPYNAYTGICGVKLFFVLSGFLMGYHYFPGALSPRYWGGFLLRRFFRIYPAYAAAMLAFWILYENNIHVPLFWNFNSDQLIAQLLLKGGIYTYWSNILEIKFYAAFPLICLPFLLWVRKPGAALGVVALLWVVLLLAVHDPYTNQSLLEKLPCFIGGLLAALLLQPLRSLTRVPPMVWNVLLCVCVVLAALAIQTSLLNAAPYLRALKNDKVLTVLCVHTVLFTALATGVAQAVFANRVIRFIGIISYSLYVTHRIIFGLGTMLPPLGIPLTMPVSISIFLVEVLVAWLVYLAVEKPFNQLGKRLSSVITGGGGIPVLPLAYYRALAVKITRRP